MSQRGGQAWLQLWVSSSQDFQGQTGSARKGLVPAAPSSARTRAGRWLHRRNLHHTQTTTQGGAPKAQLHGRSHCSPAAARCPGTQPATGSPLCARPSPGPRSRTQSSRHGRQAPWPGWTHRRTHWVCRRLTRAAQGTRGLHPAPPRRVLQPSSHSYQGASFKAVNLGQKQKMNHRSRPPGAPGATCRCGPALHESPSPLPLPRPRTSMKSGIHASWVGEGQRAESGDGSIEKHPLQKLHLGSRAFHAQSCTFIFSVGSCCARACRASPGERSFFRSAEALVVPGAPRPAGWRPEQTRRRPYTCQGLLCWRSSWTRRRARLALGACRPLRGAAASVRRF